MKYALILLLSLLLTACDSGEKSQEKRKSAENQRVTADPKSPKLCVKSDTSEDQGERRENERCLFVKPFYKEIRGRIDKDKFYAKWRKYIVKDTVWQNEHDCDVNDTVHIAQIGKSRIYFTKFGKEILMDHFVLQDNSFDIELYPGLRIGARRSDVLKAMGIESDCDQIFLEAESVDEDMDFSNVAIEFGKDGKVEKIFFNDSCC